MHQPCTSRYDVVLSDGSCGHWWRGSEPHTTGVLDYIEYRIPDDFGDPGPLVSEVFVGGKTRRGDRVSRVRKNGYLIAGRGQLHRVLYYERRYLRWHVEDDAPPPHDDPPCEIPP